MALISKYNPPLRQMMENLKKGQISYLSKSVQNEVIELLGGAVRKHILDSIRSAKYYAIMFDCTLDVSHHEQMTQITRYVNIGKMKNAL